MGEKWVKIIKKWVSEYPTCARKSRSCICRVPTCVRMLGHVFVWTDEHRRVRMKRVYACMYTGCARMHEHMRIHEHRQRVFFDNFGLPLIKTHHKHVPTPPRTPGFHLDPSTTKPKHLQVQKQNKMEDQCKTWKWENFGKLTNPAYALSKRWFCDL